MGTLMAGFRGSNVPKKKAALRNIHCQWNIRRILTPT